jgi:hypothetical protein
MAGAQGEKPEKGTPWQGGPLDDLVALLAEGSWSARIEASRGAGRLGFIDIIAGGVSEVQAGDLRGDRAMSALRAHPETSYRVDFRLPHPSLGGLEPAGEREGSIADRSAAALMRYCEEFVLTGALLLKRDDHVARIVYRRGEISTTVVDGSDDPDRLTDVMGWKSGTFVIDVEGPPFPVRMPAKSSAAKEAPTTLFGYPSPGLAAAALAPPVEPRAGAATLRPTPQNQPASAPASTAKPAAADDKALGNKDAAKPGKDVTKEAGKGASKDVAKAATPAAVGKATPSAGKAPTPAAAKPLADKGPATLPPAVDPASTRPTPRAPMPAVADTPASQRPTPRSGNQAPPPAARPTPPSHAVQPTPARLPGPATPAPIPLAKTPPPRAVPAAASAPEAEPGGYLAQPLIVHVIVGAVVGALAVVAYLAYLRAGGHPIL